MYDCFSAMDDWRYLPGTIYETTTFSPRSAFCERADMNPTCVCTDCSITLEIRRSLYSFLNNLLIQTSELHTNLILCTNSLKCCNWDDRHDAETDRQRTFLGHCWCLSRQWWQCLTVDRGSGRRFIAGASRMLPLPHYPERLQNFHITFCTQDTRDLFRS
jgi:hypothetical protein